MTRKDYVKIAAVFREGTKKLLTLRIHPDTLGIIRDEYVSRLSGVLADDNPRFDRVRFLKACGLEGRN